MAHPPIRRCHRECCPSTDNGLNSARCRFLRLPVLLDSLDNLITPRVREDDGVPKPCLRTRMAQYPELSLYPEPCDGKCLCADLVTV